LADAFTEGEWTLFAPTNEAFQGMSPSVFADDDHDSLSILQFHAVEGKTLKFEDLTCTNKIETVGGESSRTKCAKKGVEKYQTGRGNLALGTMPKIIEADISVCNGIIHGVDDILLPNLKTSSIEGEGDVGVDEEDQADVVMNAPQGEDDYNSPNTAVEDAPPFDLECPIDGLTTINGIVMEDIVPMTRFTKLEPKMAEYYDYSGMKVTTYIGIREARSRMAIHMHPFGGQTCVVSGSPATIFLEGTNVTTEYPAGTCYYMPPGVFMTAANLGDEDQLLIDVLRGEQNTVVCEKGWDDLCRGKGCRSEWD